MLLSIEVLSELGTWCCTSTDRDSKRITARSETEGLSFLTITLPQFAADLEKGLERGVVLPDTFLGYRKRGKLPIFMGGFLELIFDRKSGCLLEHPSIDAIFAVRQTCLLHKKVEIPCSDERVASAIDGYFKCEQEVRRFDASRTSSMLEDFSRVSQLLWGEILQKVDECVYNLELIPKHGPGATADRLRGNSKYNQVEWPSRLESIFPYGEYVLPNWRYYTYLDRVDFLEPGRERPSRVITVPKTLKTPRIIAIEPTAMQYMQQALLRPIVEYLESPRLNGRDNLTFGIVGFSDQTPNQRMALEGSFSGSLATLDLSEASDRVSNQLVREMLKYVPNLAEGVDASRSRKADVNGKVVRLAKFASMGSALCFPFEAMVFATLVFMGIERELKHRLGHRDIVLLRSRVRVYGDDIVVPVDYVHSVISVLEDFGLRVNRDKSFWTGKFRESCGGEYYDGVDVTPARVKQLLPTTRKDVTELVSTVALRNRFYQRGMWKTVKWLDCRIEKLIPFPTVLPSSPVLGRHSFLGYQAEKIGGRYQIPLVRGFVTVSRPPDSHLDDVPALQKFFLKQGREPFADEDHLERFGRPDVVGIKLRWASAI